MDKVLVEVYNPVLDRSVEAFVPPELRGSEALALLKNEPGYESMHYLICGRGEQRDASLFIQFMKKTLDAKTDYETLKKIHYDMEKGGIVYGE